MTNLIDRLQNAIADRYVIQREVGRGGMANVYLAHDVRHDRAVAVKVLRPELGVLLGAERFLREIRVVARLQHPHILPVHDSGEVDGALYYVMPYVEGASLRERLRTEGMLPVPEATRIAGEVAGALDLAHRRGVIHRDIKPGNILFVDGHAVVADFGIARAVHAAGGEMWETITDSGVALGTPAYMSPEQAVGSAALDARADIYSLGCVLYEMLVGEPPFVGSGGEVLIARRFTEDPPRASETRAGVSNALDEVVAKALARNPTDRFVNARELMDALAALAVTTQPSQAIRVASPASRRPVALAVASALVAVSAIAVWLTQRARRVEPQAAPAAADTVAQRREGPSTPVPGQPATPSVAAPAAPVVAADSARGESRGPASRDSDPVATAARAEAARLDSGFRSAAASALDVRQRALASGATATDLARGDSILGIARGLASRGRFSDAMQRVSLVTSSWTAAAQSAAAARRTADSIAAASTAQPTTRITPPVRDTAPTPVVTAPATPPADPRVEITAVLGRYARALESRSLSELQAAYPGMTGAQRRSWEQFFQNVQTMRANLTIADLDVSGDVAQARIAGEYRYTSGSARRQENQPVSFRATFRREGGSWRLAAVSQ